MTHPLTKTLQDWFRLSRPPFHAVGVLPFILGTLLAYKFNAVFNWEVFVLGLSGVILIMLATYHSGEYFDYRGDVISSRLHNNQFAGGTRTLQKGKISPAVALWTSIIAVITALAIGVILQFGYKTGPYTLLLGCLGALPGFFYSTEPIRLVKRGIGELFIGFCYGWLPVASAYYIQTGTIVPVINVLWLPIGLSIFNVILLNEFPDYEADIATDKKNLLYRIGKPKGMIVYIIVAVLTSLSMFAAPTWGVPFKVIYFYLPFFLISLYIIVQLCRKAHENARKLEVLCGLNIAVNLGTTLTFILVYI
ncbi:MAG: prenyltransferase [Smithella sp.]